MKTFRLYTDTEIEALPTVEWLIPDLLPRQVLAVLYGPSTVGKSFLALDMALSIATGRSWQGRKVEIGRVVYVYAEGQRGLSKRIRAWKKYNRVLSLPRAHFVPVAVQLHKEEEVRSFITAIEQKALMGDRQPALIIIDTLNRCFVAGDENRQQDMGIFVAGAMTLVERGATVLVLHHVPKQRADLPPPREPRGSNVLAGAADTTLALVPVKGDRYAMRLECNKQKDDEEFKPIFLRRQVVELERDGLGKPVTSCVVVADDAGGSSPARSEKVEVDSYERAAFAALQRCQPASRSKWEEASSLRGGTFNRAVSKLVVSGFVTSTGEFKDKRYSTTAAGLEALEAPANKALNHEAA